MRCNEYKLLSIERYPEELLRTYCNIDFNWHEFLISFCLHHTRMPCVRMKRWKRSWVQRNWSWTKRLLLFHSQRQKARIKKYHPFLYPSTKIWLMYYKMFKSLPSNMAITFGCRVRGGRCKRPRWTASSVFWPSNQTSFKSWRLSSF